MDARLIKLALVLYAFASMGATQRTKNFVVQAPTDEIARQVAVTAERCRDELAVAWLGKALPPWSRPCQVNVKVGNIGAGGATTFAFDNGEVFGWRMNIQGSVERLLDSVVPHEVSHTIFATYFRRPLPRWADEGAATLVEHESEQRRQQLLLKQVLGTTRRIPLKQLLAMKEYPQDMQSVLTLYAEGYSLADFLVQSGGRARYLSFLQHAHEKGWDSAIRTHYKIDNVAALEEQWNGWVVAGSPRGDGEGDTLLVDVGQPQPQRKQRRADGIIVRGQTPDVQPTAVARPARREPIALPRTDEARDAECDALEDDGRERPREQILGDVATAFAGEREAVNDGWTPMGGDLVERLPRPKPLDMRVELDARGGPAVSRQ